MSKSDGGDFAPISRLFYRPGWMRRSAGRLCLVFAALSIVALAGCDSDGGTRQNRLAQRVTDEGRHVIKGVEDAQLFNRIPSEREGERLPTERQIGRARSQAITPVALAFWDKKRGIVGGGVNIDGYCAGTISLTGDGGRTFRVITDVPGLVDWVTTAGRRYAWAHVASCGKNHAPFTLLGTADGGRTWKALSDERIGQASFASGLHGIAVSPEAFEGSRKNGSLVRLIQTSDGGRTWQVGNKPICHGKFKGFTLYGQAVSVPDADHAWVACTAILGTQIEGKTIYETSDGGKTWEKVMDNRRGSTTEDPLPQLGYTSGMSFTSRGFGVFYMEGELLGITSDGGRHWAPVSGQPLPPAVGGEQGRSLTHLGPATVTEPTTIFDLIRSFGGARGVVLVRSNDAGATWVALHEWARHPGSG